MPRPRTIAILALGLTGAFAAVALLAWPGLRTGQTPPSTSRPSTPAAVTPLSADPIVLPLAPKPHDFPTTDGAPSPASDAFSDERRGPGGERGFEWRVRPDYFKALKGDLDALARVEKACDETLAREPDHAEALVWKGTTLALRSGNAFRGLSVRTGQRLWDESVATMARARALEPGNSAIMLARGQCLIHMAGFHLDPRVRRELTALGVQDLLTVGPIIEPRLSRVGSSEKGEYWTALAAGLDRLGRADEARALYGRVVTELPGTAHAQRAQEWLDGR